MNHGFARRYPVGIIAVVFALFCIAGGCKHTTTGSGTPTRPGASISSPTVISSRTPAYRTSNAVGPARAPRATAEDLKKRPKLSEIFAAQRRKSVSGNVPGK